MFRLTALIAASFTVSASFRKSGESLLSERSHGSERVELPTSADPVVTSLLKDFATTGYNAAKLVLTHTDDAEVKHFADAIIRDYDELRHQSGDEASRYLALWKLGMEGRRLDIQNFEKQTSHGRPVYYHANLKRYSSVAIHWLKLLRPHVRGVRAVEESLTRILTRLETLKAQSQWNPWNPSTRSFESVTFADVHDAIRAWDSALIAAIQERIAICSEDEFFDAVGAEEPPVSVDPKTVALRDARILVDQSEGVALAFESLWDDAQAAPRAKSDDILSPRAKSDDVDQLEKLLSQLSPE